MDRREFIRLAAAMGQVAGTAASLAIDRRLPDVGAVPHDELVARLAAAGCVCR